jgi:hypothetical protein
MATQDSTPKPELLPCPFCGADAAQYSFISAGDLRYMTYCSSPASSIGCAGTSTSSKETQELADVSWNSRA